MAHLEMREIPRFDTDAVSIDAQMRQSSRFTTITLQQLRQSLPTTWMLSLDPPSCLTWNAQHQQ